MQRTVLRRMITVLLAGLLSACSVGESAGVLRPGVDTTAGPAAGVTTEAATSAPADAPPSATDASTAQPAPDAAATGTAGSSPEATAATRGIAGLGATATAITVTNVADLARDVDRLIDTTVTVDGEVGTVVDAMALTIGAPGGDANSAVLVVSGLQQVEASPGAMARVTGTLRRFDLQAFEQELGRDLDDATFSTYAGRPAILASTVQTSG